MTTRTHRLPAWITPPMDDYDNSPAPGQRERDWDLGRRPSLQIFDPETHRGPTRPAEIGSLFDPLVRQDRDGPNVGVPVEGESLDRLAWYRTFRHGPAWGIYIRESAVVSIADLLSSERRPAHPDGERIAWTVLYLHEYAHFLFDIAASALEQIVGTDVYEAYRREVRCTVQEWHLEAESVCNAYAYRTGPFTGYRQRLRNFMRHQPVGYRDFGRYLSDADFDTGVETVLGHMLRGLGGRPGLGFRALFEETGHRISPSLVPVHVVYEPDEAPAFRLITCLSDLETSKTFEKELGALPLAVREAWTKRVRPALQADVRAAGNFKKLQGSRDLYSVRVHGSYRAILRREGGERWTVLTIGHRREVYA